MYNFKDFPNLAKKKHILEIKKIIKTKLSIYKI